jgi:DNA-binding NarL/FixJ family response regulator
MRILIADDQPKIRFALRVLLTRHPEIEIVGEALDATDLLSQLEYAYPDLVLLGWELPDIAATDAMYTITTTWPYLRIIVLSGRPEARRPALDAGADAFVSKTDPPEVLLAAIGCVGPLKKSPRPKQKSRDKDWMVPG